MSQKTFLPEKFYVNGTPSTWRGEKSFGTKIISFVHNLHSILKGLKLNSHPDKYRGG
ncbi:MAG TPA: hypothetical protein VIU13_15140 [Chryseolinea sp.]